MVTKKKTHVIIFQPPKGCNFNFFQELHNWFSIIREEHMISFILENLNTAKSNQM